MAHLIIIFFIVFVNTLLMAYFLSKDYKTNSDTKKVITNSQYSKIAMIFGFANFGITIGLLDYLYEKYFAYRFNETGNFWISWILIPSVCIFIYFSIFYWTYAVFKFKQKHGIKDKRESE